MGRIGRGWSLAKQSLTVVRQDGSLSALVVLGGLTSILIAAALFVPAAIAYSANSSSNGNEIAAAALLVVGTYLTTAAGVFFGVALAAAAADVLDGKDATVGKSVAVARTRLRAILGWALVLLTVNLVLQMLRERGGLIGQIIAGIGGVAWGLVTFLVVPILALEGLGPRAALSRSGGLFRERWGEQVVGTASITAVFFVVGFLPAAALAAIGIHSGRAVVAVPLVAIAVVIGIGAIVLGAAARSVFSVALYRFAAGSGSTGPFSTGDLQQSVSSRGSSSSF